MECHSKALGSLEGVTTLFFSKLSFPKSLIRTLWKYVSYPLLCPFLLMYFNHGTLTKCFSSSHTLVLEYYYGKALIKRFICSFHLQVHLPKVLLLSIIAECLPFRLSSSIQSRLNKYNDTIP